MYKAMNPEDDTSWSVTDYLLAVIADNSAFRLWQAGSGKGKKPKPIPRPGDTKKYAGDALPVADMTDWLGWDAPAEVVVSGLSGEERAVAVRSALGRGESRADVAVNFGISVSTVGRIARGDSWGEVPAS